MARNQEKSQSVLNRWYNFKVIGRGATAGGGGDDDESNTTSLSIEELQRRKRPPHVSLSKTIRECEYWRKQVIREFNDKLGLIQNASLGEHKIRDLNDDMNKLLREKYAWERRIVELNGPDYRNRGKLYDVESAIGVGSGANRYMYFGAARELDAVRELLNKQKQVQQKSDQKGSSHNRLLPSEYYYDHDCENSNLASEADDNNEQSLLLSMLSESSTIGSSFDFSQQLLDEEEWRRQALERKRQLLLQKLQAM